MVVVLLSFTDVVIVLFDLAFVGDDLVSMVLLLMLVVLRYWCKRLYQY